MNIRDALQLSPARRILPDGTPYVLSRPTALDLIEAIEFSKENGSQLHAWLCWRHLRDSDEKPVFHSLAEALAAPASIVTHIGTEADKLYSEGRD